MSNKCSEICRLVCGGVVLVMIFAVASSCAQTPKPGTPEFTVIPGKTGTYDYFQVFEPFSGEEKHLEGVWLMGSLTDVCWELIVFRDGLYSLRLLKGGLVHDAEVGQWQLRGQLMLAPDAVLEESEANQYRPRNLTVLATDGKLVMVPPRTQLEFQKFGPLDQVCFKQTKR